MYVSGRILKIFFVVSLSVLISGCIKTWHYFYSEGDGGKLITPDKSFPVSNFKRNESGRFGPGLVLEKEGASTFDVDVVFTYSEGKVRVRIIKPAYHKLEFVSGFYQLNEGKKLVLIIDEQMYDIPLPNSSLDQNILSFDAPERLDFPRLTGTRISSKVYKDLKKNDDDVHRAYFEFKIDDEAYILDARFKIKVTKEYHLDMFATGI